MITAVGRRRRRPLRFTMFAAFALILGMVAATLSAASPARAAVTSHTVSFGGWEVGGFLSSTGHLVYCVEPGAFEPAGDQHGPVVSETLPAYSAQFPDLTGWNAPVVAGAVSGDVLRRLNWLLSTHGQTTDPNTAAVVQLAVWLIREDPGTAAWVDHHLGWVSAHGGADHVAHARSLAAEARAVTGPHPAPKPEGPLALSLGEELGTGSASYPAGTTELRLTGATFADGGAVLDTGADAGSAAWSAELHANGWQREHRVSLEGEWQRESTVWPAALTLHPPVEASQQMLGAMVGPATETTRVQLDPVSTVIDSQFSPVLTTRAESPFVERGTGEFADRIEFSVAEESERWAERRRADGATEYAPIVAEGTLYGPFSQPQEERDEPPHGAPVAARTTLVADRGPGEYRVAVEIEPEESGFYSWVWRIDEREQSAEIREAELLPAGYAFADRFGLAAEGQVVPSWLRWSTELESKELPLDGLVLRDRLTVSLHAGAWLRDEAGERIPARVRLTVYGTDERPQRSPRAPVEAREIDRSFVTLTRTGEVSAYPIALPFETRGWVTVQACLLHEDQEERYRGLLQEWCDDFGVPAETARIVVPTVRTEAQPEALVGEAFHDVAIVEGPVPEGAEIGFTYHLRPVVGEPKYDERWTPIIGEAGETVRWTAEELAVMSESERCLAQPVAVTARVAVPGASSVRSPDVLARSAGVGYWVEDLTMPHPETGEPHELHRGACGLENERTVISLPGGGSESADESLARTGGGHAPWLALLGLAPIAGAGLIVAGSRRRR